MKKVLLMGGSHFLLPVINAIHKLGYYAITCDYLPDNIIHKYSDEYYNVSTTDKHGVLQLADKLKVDGLMSFACDAGVETGAYVTERLNLPGHPYESVKILQNKDLFRNFLEKNGFNVPKARGYDSLQKAYMSLGEFKFPIMVKPVDSAGSKGVKRVDSVMEFAQAAENALSHSRCGKIIVEEFIQQKGFASDSECFSVNGKLVFASFNNQYFDRYAENPYTPAGFTWPSKMPMSIQGELRSELQRLMYLLNLGTSIYNVETRQGIDGRPYIMEVSPRGGGNRLAEMLQYASGIDLLSNAVRAAVGDEVIGINGDPVYEGYWGEVILHANNAGIYKKVCIDDVLKKYIFKEDIWVSEGVYVNSFTGANTAIGTLIFKCESQKQMDDIMDNIGDYVKVVVK